jgi:hypothetical protein
MEQSVDSYCLIRGTEVDLPFAAVEGTSCRFETTELGGLNIYAGTPENPKNCAPTIETPHTISVREVGLELTVNDECTEFGDGLAVTATIPFDSLERTCTCPTVGMGAEACEPLEPDYVGGNCDGCNANYSNLEELMAMFNGGESLPADCPTAEGEPGVCLTAAFNGVLLDFSPVFCDEM